MAEDEIALKAKLKQIKLEEKRRKREARKEKKMQKKLEKQRKKEATLKAKVDAGVLKLPSEPKKSEGAEPPEAEIIEPTAIEWKPKSTITIDEKRKRIDRLSAEGVQSLKSRFREKYGEELEVPDMYERTYEYNIGEPEEPSLPESVEAESSEIKVSELGEKKGFGSIRDKSKAKAKPTGPRPLRFFDLRRPLFLREKFTNEETSGGKKILFLLLDIFLLLVIPLTILRIITTIIYVIKDGRDAKQADAVASSGTNQASEASS
jgi:hypothetical protein